MLRCGDLSLGVRGISAPIIAAAPPVRLFVRKLPYWRLYHSKVFHRVAKRLSASTGGGHSIRSPAFPMRSPI
jgi:hypothetical protein